LTTEKVIQQQWPDLFSRLWGAWRDGGFLVAVNS